MSYLTQMLAIFLIPAARCFAFGHAVGDARQGWAVLMANAGRVLTHRQLLREVWGPSHVDQSH